MLSFLALVVSGVLNFAVILAVSLYVAVLPDESVVEEVVGVGGLDVRMDPSCFVVEGCPKKWLLSVVAVWKGSEGLLEIESDPVGSRLELVVDVVATAVGGFISVVMVDVGIGSVVGLGFGLGFRGLLEIGSMLNFFVNSVGAGMLNFSVSFGSWLLVT